MRVLIHGACGKMGRELRRLCLEGYGGASLACGVDAVGDGAYTCFEAVAADILIDCVIDFSYHTAVRGVLDFALSRKIPAVIATTGLQDEELARVRCAAREIPVFHSPNTSIGIALLSELAKTAALALADSDVEIVERHHREKVDAPSGTALMIASELKSVLPELENNCGRRGISARGRSEIGIHAVRAGGAMGRHEVIIATESESLTLIHEAHSRTLYAEGAIAAGRYVLKKPPGLYCMRDLICARGI